MVTLDRQEMIATNKSLRLIKNELEHLLEKGVVTDEQFDNVMSILPTEQPIRAGASTVGSSMRTPSTMASPAPSSNPTSPPTSSMANMALAHNPTPSPAPPAYNTTGPPSLPVRNNPPPPPPPSKPVIAHAKALYKYAAADDRDLSFERDDRIVVHEYMNNDWWMGKNTRTGAEGIFPKNYVEVDYSAGGANGYTDEKAGGFYAPPPQPSYVNNGPPAPQNPYNANVPPMAIAADGSGSGSQQGGGKGSEMGKKFGKKLGNAAIFGAGATIGGNIVNSIF
ncbi:SH3 domain-containing protein [Pseudomassariella vexata]|uniref:Class E vacuolar protein-sorting machinery protein HSE1 n=1 Tax=Pseudomassariella vexata TaxID=1141098 RepID=A0A1Y2E6W7_9PEZI|nr:SH3 domain-containing protein [Pseudomassariella vexata]ORY67308.1 SH3 domain-containing protein [Pseudomassariella vexata]